MGRRVKITMYADPSSFPLKGMLDLNHATGMTERGFERLIGTDGTGGFQTGLFEDWETEVENDGKPELDFGIPTPERKDPNRKVPKEFDLLRSRGGSAYGRDPGGEGDYADGSGD